MMHRLPIGDSSVARLLGLSAAFLIAGCGSIPSVGPDYDALAGELLDLATASPGAALAPAPAPIVIFAGETVAPPRGG